MIIKNIAKKIIKGYLRNFFWSVYGHRFEKQAIPRKPETLLFICMGNICRSAYAHQYSMKKLYEMDAPIVSRIASAGLLVKDKRSPKLALTAAEMLGIELKQNTPTQVTEKAVRAADMVLAMEPGQITALRKRYPDYSTRFFLLANFENDFRRTYTGWARYHIEDPYGKPLSQFTQCFQRIERCIEGLLARTNREG